MNKFLTVVGVIIAFIALVVYLTPAKDSVKIYSKVLDEKRTILVHLPKGYETSGKKYPVLYHLDGGNVAIASFQTPYYTQARETLEKLEGSHVPEMIMIGIANTDRSRDMLPVKSQLYLSAGGAHKFLAFLTDELIPFVDRNYRTSGSRVLYGMSLSGLFAVYAMLERPGVFFAVIASSPAFGVCPGYITKKAETFFAKKEPLTGSLYLIYGRGESSYVSAFVPLLVKRLEAAKPVGFRWRVKVVDGGGHIPPSSLHDGLKFIFPAQGR